MSAISRKKSLGELSQRSDYENFLDAQIARLIAAERARSTDKFDRLQELTLSIDYCKQHLREVAQRSSSSAPDDRQRDVMAKIVELSLEMELLKEFQSAQSRIATVQRVCGHDFIAQPTSAGRNPYCEVCLSAIWRLAQAWRRCSLCGYRTHEKCLDEVRRPCVGLLLNRQSFEDGATVDGVTALASLLNLDICPEITLFDQNYQCDECHAPIGYGLLLFCNMIHLEGGSELEARLCDYTGRYYCRRCHWNDEMIIPARVVHNWDVSRRPVCRASKQLLSALERRPLIDLHAQNPALFKYVSALQRICELRKSILFMKCYFVSCKEARKLRILQYLNRYQHFVDTDTMYTMEDLIKLSNGKLLGEIETVVGVFRAHITTECEICQGNAFICELCDSKEPIYPFNAGVALCADCGCCFHRPCHERVSRRCSRCARRRARQAAAARPLSDDEDNGEELESKECDDHA